MKFDTKICRSTDKGAYMSAFHEGMYRYESRPFIEWFVVEKVAWDEFLSPSSSIPASATTPV